jgi:hypothetical protein
MIGESIENDRGKKAQEHVKSVDLYRGRCAKVKTRTDELRMTGRM